MILIAFHARVTDWQALQRVWRETCVASRPRLATRMGLYRNGHNASKVLVLIELPDTEARVDLEAWKQPILPYLIPDSFEEYIWDIVEHEPG